MNELTIGLRIRHRSPSLDTIPLDILFDISQLLPIQSVLALRQFGCHHPYAQSLGFFLRTLVQQNIPIPYFDGKSPESLSALELERFTCRALALRINWTNPNPSLKREIHFGEAEKRSDVFCMEFLPGRGNRWLVSVTSQAYTKYIIQCWDLTVLQPVCIAKLTYTDKAYNRVVINNDPSSPATMAIQSKPEVTEILTIDFEEKDPESAFVPLSAIDGRRVIHLLSGSTLVTRCQKRDGKLSIWDISDQPHEKIQLVSPSLLQEDRCRTMHFCDDYLIIFLIRTVELYSTIPRPNNIAMPGVPISYPLAQHSFHYDFIDQVNMSEQVSWHAARLHRPSPINIVIRFWPGDTLHHFVLDPNPAYVPGRETSLYNLPYLVQPTLVQKICSPVWLLSRSATALGRYGTMLLLDNHDPDGMVYSDFQHQQLSVRILTATGGSSTSPHGSHDSMAFRVRGGSYWNRAAIDEESGRIVVSNVDGTITLFEYL
ncbi:uncharacterized protein F5891DRAFT_1280214 [Suillus fuscotomentosus]|uniref:F-box domain-containing protein n=1 Tax=Suillus fuscotomentosus TaxID=1912939 RepID=A0AAD4HI63_9AGAM|nr:uncharacterized protein F5891DRAFT_1280214 [Suillus fuscotomentosus]KAG1897071.1 hypothetical protein F5891DRAFT_1280214 [Suillus fuscotomentosus]